jgi:hypothetical protein
MYSTQHDSDCEVYVVSLEGPPGSDKSTVLSILKEKGYPVLPSFYLEFIGRRLQQIKPCPHSLATELAYATEWIERLLKLVHKLRKDPNGNSIIFTNRCPQISTPIFSTHMEGDNLSLILQAMTEQVALEKNLLFYQTKFLTPERRLWENIQSRFEQTPSDHFQLVVNRYNGWRCVNTVGTVGGSQIQADIVLQHIQDYRDEERRRRADRGY